MKQVLAMLLIAASLATSAPCLAGTYEPGYGAYAAPAATLPPEKKFRIGFTNGSSVKAKGSDIFFQGDSIAIRDAATGTVRTYDRSQVTGIYRGSHWAIGLGIGAGAGATAGALGGYFGGSCEGSNEPSDCENMRPLGGILLGVIGAAIGGGIGAGIGAAIPKKAKFQIAPTVMSAPGQPLAGGGLGISGRF